MLGRPVGYKTISPRGRRKGDKRGGAEDIKERNQIRFGNDFRSRLRLRDVAGGVNSITRGDARCVFA
jgi:hypothetical protein